MLIFDIIIIFIGLLIGSFLNVVILRTHAGEEFVKSRSRCPHCRHELAPIDLVPVLSWLWLRGRCRYCKKPISYQYALVELITACLFLLIFNNFWPVSGVAELAALLLWLYVAGSLIVLAVYDLKWLILPDKVLLPLIAPAALIAIINSLHSGSWQPLLGAALAAVLFGGVFYGLAAVSGGKWMGGGDIKLAFVMGLLLGLKLTAVAMFVAFNLAAMIGLAFIGLRRLNIKQQIPFGPFLIIGIFYALLFGHALIDWYFAITGLSYL